jgi:hypothetical protein
MKFANCELRGDAEYAPDYEYYLSPRRFAYKQFRVTSENGLDVRQR